MSKKIICQFGTLAPELTNYLYSGCFTMSPSSITSFPPSLPSLAKNCSENTFLFIIESIIWKRYAATISMVLSVPTSQDITVCWADVDFVEKVEYVMPEVVISMPTQNILVRLMLMLLMLAKDNGEKTEWPRPPKIRCIVQASLVLEVQNNFGAPLCPEISHIHGIPTYVWSSSPHLWVFTIATRVWNLSAKFCPL